MDKKNYLIITILFTIWLVCLLNKSNSSVKALTDANQVNISTIISGSIHLTISSGSNINLGALVPGTPICNASGSIASVITNAANGYTLGIDDGSDTNSAMTNGEGVYIPDATGGTIETPALWTTGTAGFQGLGISMWAAETAKEAKWGTGTTACDANNKWAAVPAATNVGHTVTGYVSGENTSSWSWKLDASDAQATGLYSGNSTFTATAVFT